jgi:hypothetical protein
LYVVIFEAALAGACTVIAEKRAREVAMAR